MTKNVIIAIDGPAGSGKSTAAKEVAERLGFLYLDTGAMYRAITFAAIENGIVDNIPAIISMTKDIDLDLKYEDGVTKVFWNKRDITGFIRKPTVSSKVSEVSKIPEVREEMVRLQKEIGKNGSLVAEGRDTTTVVFPDADIKIYLTAALIERAGRRYKELTERNENVSLDEVRQNIEKRDKIDSGRDVSPLRKADDAYEIDTTDLTIEEEINLIIDKIKELISN
jgi:cytidylate kinase